ncbi:hypothetical protein HAX54_028854 [Datura stramonium]|uniref:Disease resistance N-terminal domain-containing protein n=1 Tax=Datura stramonium TaxID=4076 RepID=A0ABS8V685_DATST|nr:hypothetical protein [Datura stramonium]
MDKDFRAGFASGSPAILLSNFTTFTVKEISNFFGVGAELLRLERMLLKIQAMVDVIELGYATFGTSLLKQSWDIWLDEANRLIYNVDDMLEEISLELGLCKGDTLVGRELLSHFKLNIPHAISELVKDIQELVTEMDKFFMVELVKIHVPKLVIRKQHSFAFSSSVDEALMVGRVEQTKEVLKMLSRNDVSVICITGMGGIGKSTFAQFISMPKKW